MFKGIHKQNVQGKEEGGYFKGQLIVSILKPKTLKRCFQEQFLQEILYELTL